MDSPPPSSKWYYGMGTVLAALFLFGPLAFPLLWKSPRFSRAWKTALTIAVTALMVYLLFETWHLVEIILGQILSYSIT